MATLWTCVHVTLSQLKGHSEMVELYLERSRNRAPSVLFVCHAQPLDRNPVFDVSWSKFEAKSWPRYRSS